jgi:short-subunit dehydrogenase
VRFSNPAVILITGASSGIGAALACEYAAAGRTLLLTGRDPGRLDEVAARARQAGAVVEGACLDVCDSGALEAWIVAMDERHPIDLVIANAGTSGGHIEERASRGKEVFAVNVAGLFNTVLPLLPRMRARGRGQIAAMSSIASFRGLPGFAFYCASKAAVRVYAEALRGELAPYGIGVSAICPGFVRSPMTDSNDFTMPFLMDAAAAARRIRKGLAANRGRIAFPLPMYVLGWAMMALPQPLTDLMLAKGAPARA